MVRARAVFRMLGLEVVYLGNRSKTRLIFMLVLLTGSLSLLCFLLYEDTPTKPGIKKQISLPPSSALIPLPRNAQRQKKIDEVCHAHNKRRPAAVYAPPIKANVYVEPAHRVFYCPVQKAGSSFWMRTLTAMRSEQFSNPYDMLLQHHNLMYHTSWGKVTPQAEMQKVLKSAFSFMFVREPYGRIFSAYVDKIYYPNKIYWPKLTKDIARVAGRKKTNGYDVTFADTVKYLMKLSPKDQQSADMHFRPMHMLCNPCDVTYKFIGKLETFQPDVDYLLDYFKNKYQDFNIKFEDFESESAFDDIRRHVSMLFYMIDNTKLPDKMSKFKLLQRGWSDLHIRGYLSKLIPLPFIEAQASTVTKETFTKAIQDALTIPVDKAAVKRQREEAMVQAYRTVPMELLRKLRDYLRTDCQMFDYNCSPAHLFKRDKNPFPDTKHVYLKGF